MATERCGVVRDETTGNNYQTVMLSEYYERNKLSPMHTKNYSER